MGEAMIFYTCDSPRNGVACGAPAISFYDGGSYHRPLCIDCGHLHYESKGKMVHPISSVDPEKAPQKPSVQTEDRRVPRRESAASFPPQPIHEQPSASPGPPFGYQPPAAASRPPLKTAFAELATTLLMIARDKIEQWSRR
jgi:hypothetical protein